MLDMILHFISALECIVSCSGRDDQFLEFLACKTVKGSNMEASELIICL